MLSHHVGAGRGKYAVDGVILESASIDVEVYGALKDAKLNLT